MRVVSEIALIGDFNESILAHLCIPEAIQLAAAKLNLKVKSDWVPTSQLKALSEKELSSFDGFWCVPGSPYVDRQSVLRVIHYARTSLKPYFGTCGGYQHALLEYAIHELGLPTAELQEENPAAAFPLISALPCRLVDEARPILIEEGSRLNSIMKNTQLFEEYRCGFGMNPLYTDLFSKSALKFVAFNEEKTPQAFELHSHPFFMGTAFQPERSARSKTSHPLIEEFLKVIHSHLS
jgi:CTP synthase (UTP-ammonia lyase)